MKRSYFQRPSPETGRHVRVLAEQAFSRAAGAPLVSGNSVRILKDAAENYPAWLDAMRSAEKSIHFESYIIYDDDMGWEFAEVLAEKARQGVRVRLIYDWLGALGKSSRRFWRYLRQSGVEVRCFNPPRMDHPLGWLSRDHRKMIAVDGRIGFVAGLCVGRMWAGWPERSIKPWRDTGIIVQGPAVADIERAFADVWATMGPPVPDDEIPERTALHPVGDVALRVVANIPNTAGLFRLDQLIAAVARETLWLTDAYFVGLTPYVQSLRAAAKDGVDVRLLVPGTTDIPVLSTLSRAGYQPLLEAGVRIFEWNGPMLHAKTAVADGRWARIGSSNLNISSWIGNYELDVAVEDEDFALRMERMYIEDLARSTEIVLGRRYVACPVQQRPKLPRKMKGKGSGSIGRGVIRVSRVVEAAITNRRVLGPADAKIMLSIGAMLLALAVVAAVWPRLLAVPYAAVTGWIGLALLVRAYRIRKRSGSDAFDTRGREEDGLIPEDGKPKDKRSNAPHATDRDGEPG
ncbi:MAG TPA: phospholipase D-like domain-containing protein [Deltaproteobacteria bacterium]|nr:phospholipase D-like domain-containing protein [Deltaproteobacteria bacterium]